MRAACSIDHLARSYQSRRSSLPFVAAAWRDLEERRWLSWIEEDDAFMMGHLSSKSGRFFVNQAMSRRTTDNIEENDTSTQHKRLGRSSPLPAGTTTSSSDDRSSLPLSLLQRATNSQTLL